MSSASLRQTGRAYFRPNPRLRTPFRVSFFTRLLGGRFCLQLSKHDELRVPSRPRSGLASFASSRYAGGTVFRPNRRLH